MTQTIDKEVISTLRAHEHEPKEAGVARVRLFGSGARGDSSETSDVDLLAQFDDASHFPDRLGTHRERLPDLLGRTVDPAHVPAGLTGFP